MSFWASLKRLLATMRYEIPIPYGRRWGLAFFCLIMDELFDCGFLHIDDSLLMLFVAHHYLLLPPMMYPCRNEYTN